MNTNALKKFAQEARRKLMQQVAARLEFVLTSDSPELREKAAQVRKLSEGVKKFGKVQLIDKVAYTWFNRFMALRFMDVNDYQPLNVRVVSPIHGQTTIEILNLAKQGEIPVELKINKSKVLDILDGRISSSNPQNEAYKEILIASCNYLHTVFPFLFEQIDDFTELLLPDDLTSEFSIVTHVLNGMSDEDCKQVEIIGWLYQFYISEKKDEVFASKSKVKKEDIPAATQLFTPRWIVEYMVQNTVGKLWLQNKPNSKLREHMPYFIESPTLEAEEYLKISSPEEITLLDQASGSGHILVYGFDLLTKIYEEEGYNQSEIAELIITKNLHGFEIDERAAQLAGMALLFKAREYQKRLFKAKQVPKPNILCYSDLYLTTVEIDETFTKVGIIVSNELIHDFHNMRQATNLGSLICPQASTSEINEVTKKLENVNAQGDAFFSFEVQELLNALAQLTLLVKKYHCVVDNPPYMGGGNMNAALSDFVKANYPDSKSDSMACFIEAGLNSLHAKGFLGMINQHSWMFLSSYDALRKKLIDNIVFDTLLHLGSRTFPEIGGEVVQNAAFTFWNTNREITGVYIRLIDFDKTELKRDNTLQAIRNNNCGWFYTANQRNFEKIPGSPIAYWVSNNTSKIFKNNKNLSAYLPTKQGMATGNNERFIRFWFEVGDSDAEYSCDDISNRLKKWFPYNKGGSFVKWYGNQELLISFDDTNFDILSKQGNHCPSRDKYFKTALTWTLLVGNTFGARLVKNHIFDVNGMSAFPSKEISNYVLGLFNSKVSYFFLSIINPTLAFQKGNIDKLPFIYSSIDESTIDNCVNLSIEYWTISETAWDFQQNEFIRLKGQDLMEAYELFQQYWRNRFFQLHKNEEELNRQFIEIYGLQEELHSDVALEDITILKKETSIENGELVFHVNEVLQQFISYSVGCMFGRFSLDKNGLLIANQGETFEDYLKKIELDKNGSKFLPDEDNIIPLLDDEWFEDDIVGKFYSFLKACFGDINFQKNITFIEEALGKDIRKFFVKDFYSDHLQRYKKRPIYWMFSSPKGYFNVLIYMHRYTPDTINNILNNYLREFIEKLKTRKEHFVRVQETGSAGEQSKAIKEMDKIEKMILDCREYERDILYPLATERIEIDLDDGVLVNYNKFGKAVQEVSGLNDKKTKEKVRAFDWIDASKIK